MLSSPIMLFMMMPSTMVAVSRVSEPCTVRICGLRARVPPTFWMLGLTPGTVAPRPRKSCAVGTASTSSREITWVVEVARVSTVGAWPLTVSVSSSEPTFISALTVAVKFDGQVDPLPDDGREAAQREGHRVGALPQIDDRIEPLRVGDDRPHLFDQRGAGCLDRDAWHHRARGISHLSGDRALRRRRMRQRPRHHTKQPAINNAPDWTSTHPSDEPYLANGAHLRTADLTAAVSTVRVWFVTTVAVSPRSQRCNWIEQTICDKSHLARSNRGS